MNNEQAAKIFDDAIAAATDAETADNRRLLKAYFTNPEFRAAMEQKVWEINQGAA